MKLIPNDDKALEAEIVPDPLEIKNILCPVDFSEYSDRAFRYAASLAIQFGSRLFLQHTVERAQYVLAAGIGPGVLKSNPVTELHHAREAIQKMLASSGVGSSQVTVLLNQGDVSTKILETIVKEPIDLVVMGTHGRKGFNRFVLGSVTEGIMNQAACPVLAVNRPEREATLETEKTPYRTILLGTDFSHHSDLATAHALRWGSRLGARVILLHVVQETYDPMRGMVHLLPEYNPSFERQIAAARERIRLIAGEVPEPAIAFEVRHGNPREEILRVAHEADADLIVTGARGLSGSATPWGSVSSAIVRDGRFPVLVARERRSS